MSVYIALDGPDGCGKTSQAEALVAHIDSQGRDVLHVREPGSTPVGEALRELLLSPATGELQAITEVLLFSAARAETVQRVVAPALSRGTVVVAERCFLSTLVYQVLATDCTAAGDQSWFEDLTRRVHGACLPDAVFVLDVPPATALQRRGDRATEDRIEARGARYHERVRHGFVAAAAREPRAVLVDAARTFDEVQTELRTRLEQVAGWVS